MTKWYDKYVGFPFKHLGDDPTKGIDCVNLLRLVFKQELQIHVPLASYDFCNIIDEDWFNKTSNQFFEEGIKTKQNDFGWNKVLAPKQFDILLMSVGSTNVTNHCAMYVGEGKILQTMFNRDSAVYPYKTWFKQYTTGIYRWKDLPS